MHHSIIKKNDRESNAIKIEEIHGNRNNTESLSIELYGLTLSEVTSDMQSN